ILGTWLRGGGGNNIYNTIIVSMFVLLLVNPYLITEVGFQLSYLAVFGIIYVHPKLFAIFKTSSKLWNRIWEITSVSISAQLATFPLAALYFHKFPSLFMVSNLFVIPTATIIIYGVMLLMIVSWLPLIASFVAKLLAAIIWFLNEVVLFIEKVPYSVVDGIAWSVAETWLVYGVIVCMVLFLVRKIPAYFHGALLACFVLLVISSYKANYISKQNKILVYNINKTTAIDFVSGNKNYLLADANFIHDENAIRFNVLQNWFWMGAKNNHLEDVNNVSQNNSQVVNWINENYVVFQNKKIGIVGNDDIGKNSEKNLDLDLLVLRHINYLDVNALLEKYSAGQIVLDSSWPKWKVKKVKDALISNGIMVHAVGTDKAFELTI
ncbi:MAG: ComEC/Rec2 family competence protein, partial [Bacteroidia bacterium]|nr:ComEC/Rec2 family competence protein [Bacteroidia bacterium]